MEPCSGSCTWGCHPAAAREQGRDSPTGIWDVENEDGSRSTIYRVDDGDQASERRRIEREKVDRAWEMLRNLIIDARESD